MPNAPTKPQFASINRRTGKAGPVSVISLINEPINPRTVDLSGCEAQKQTPNLSSFHLTQPLTAAKLPAKFLSPTTPAKLAHPLSYPPPLLSQSPTVASFLGADFIGASYIAPVHNATSHQISCPVCLTDQLPSTPAIICRCTTILPRAILLRPNEAIPPHENQKNSKNY